MNPPKPLLLFLALILTFTAAFGKDESEDFAKSAQRCWSAFECAALADITKNREAQEKLFNYGYEEGKRFLVALKSEKIAQEDISKHVPVVVALSLQGPSNDFILGAIWAQAVDSVFDDIKDSNGEYPTSPELRAMIAERMFRERNCEILADK